MAAGVRQRHGLNCNRKGRCHCPWEASVYSKRDAKKIRKTFPTKAAAVTWRDDSRSAVRKGSMSAPTAITISEAADAWLARARAGTSLTRSGDPYKPSALRAYADALRLRVNPAIGSMRLSEVRAIDLKRLLVNPLIAEGRSASNVGVTLLPLRAIYREAIEEGVVVVNPTSGLKLPRVRSRRDRIATPAECAKLLAELSAADRRVWATAMYAGLRRGELMELHVEDVDLPGGVIRVCRGWDAEAGEIATKSGKDRKVPIAGALRSHLAEHVLALGWREGLLFGAAPAVPFCDRTRRSGVGGRRAEQDHVARVSAHLRLADDRRRRQREGAQRVHGALENRGHDGSVRPPDARQRERGGGSARRVLDGAAGPGGDGLNALRSARLSRS
jgi:integrase